MTIVFNNELVIGIVRAEMFSTLQEINWEREMENKVQ